MSYGSEGGQLPVEADVFNKTSKKTRGVKRTIHEGVQEKRTEYQPQHNCQRAAHSPPCWDTNSEQFAAAKKQI